MERHKSVKLEKNNTTFVKKNPCVLTTSLTTCGRPLTISNQMRWESSAVLDVQSIGLPKLPRGDSSIWEWRLLLGCCCEEHIWKKGFLNFLVLCFVSITKCRYFCFQLEDIVRYYLCDCSWFISLSQVYTKRLWYYFCDCSWFISLYPRLVLQGIKLKWLRKQRNSARSTMWMPRAVRQSIVGCWNC